MIDKNSKPNPKATKQRAPFKVPRQLFSQLDEFSNGGFFLIMLNSDGNPSIYAKYDSPIIAVGMKKVGLDYFRSQDIVQKDMMLDSVAPEYDSSEDDDEDDEDDEDEDDEPSDPDLPPDEPPSTSEQIPV